jgi:hypothetical protein
VVMLVIGNQVIAVMVTGFDKQNASAEGGIGHGAILASGFWLQTSDC